MGSAPHRGRQSFGQGQDRRQFRPFVSPQERISEFTVLPVILGALLGMVFGASSLYLVLKVGLTVSASIPVAVISLTLFRFLSKLGMRKATILENNIVQTGGSAGESIAFGIGVTMPAIMMLGFDLELGRIMVVGTLGAVLGILMMIPLRRALIVEQHGKLKYPEGTACAEVLKAGVDRSTSGKDASRLGRLVGSGTMSGKTIFYGFGIGLIYKTLMAAFHLWKDIPTKIFGGAYKGASVSAEISPELMGVGYIIGPRVASIMCAGGVLSYLVLIPLIKFFGDGLPEALLPAAMPIRDMLPDQIRGNYVMYIGAGAVAAGGIISVCKSLPIIWKSIRSCAAGASFGFGKSANGRGASVGRGMLRTEQDLPMKFVLIGIILLVTAISLYPPLKMNVLGALLIVLFGFLFSTVSSRVTGEIGSSSNPISGMTVATLILTCLIFLVLGWTTPPYYVTALSVGAVVAIAASNAGTTSQDLKTGFLIGATPKYQQYAILIGALASALILGPVLMRLNDAGTVYVPPISYSKVESAKVGQKDAKDGLAIPVVAPEALANLELCKRANSPKQKNGKPFSVLSVQSGGDSVVSPQSDVAPGNYLVDDSGVICYKFMTNFSPLLKASFGGGVKAPQRVTLSQKDAGEEAGEYFVWFNQDAKLGRTGKYLAREDGSIAFLVDPGVNGTFSQRPDGSQVAKFGAPQATLMATIIKGILSHELPWGLVLTGVLIAVLLEMCQVPSLAFAVGLYLPLSSSAPIFVGGLIRWFVDKRIAARNPRRVMTPEQIAAEGDKSKGVLLASGYIAGGAIAGIVIAFVAGVFTNFDNHLFELSTKLNPFFGGNWADGLSLIPFVIIGVVLCLVGLGKTDSAERTPMGGQPGIRRFQGSGVPKTVNSSISADKQIRAATAPTAAPVSQANPPARRDEPMFLDLPEKQSFGTRDGQSRNQNHRRYPRRPYYRGENRNKPTPSNGN